MIRNIILSLLLFVITLPLSFDPLYAQEMRSKSKVIINQEDEIQVTSDSTYRVGIRGRVSSCLLGIVGGIAGGLLIAKIADYPLEEGGILTPFIFGGGLGGFVGYKIGSAIDHKKALRGTKQISENEKVQTQKSLFPRLANRYQGVRGRQPRQRMISLKRLILQVLKGQTIVTVMHLT